MFDPILPEFIWKVENLFESLSSTSNHDYLKIHENSRCILSFHRNDFVVTGLAYEEAVDSLIPIEFTTIFKLHNSHNESNYLYKLALNGLSQIVFAFIECVI